MITTKPKIKNDDNYVIIVSVGPIIDKSYNNDNIMIDINGNGNHVNNESRTDENNRGDEDSYNDDGDSDYNDDGVHGEGDSVGDNNNNSYGNN